MLNLTRVVNDPRLAQAFSIIRDAGTWVKGIWVNNPTTIPSYGVVQPTTPEELKMVPEGDRVPGSFSFHTSTAIYRAGINNGVETNSDICIWRGVNYRVYYVFPWEDFGYYKAIAARMPGE